MLREPSISPLVSKPRVSSKLIMMLIIIGLVLAAVIAYFAYFQGIKKGYKDLETDKLLVEQLSKTVEELKVESESTQQSLVFSERQLQIQEEAYKQLNKAYANSEEKNSVLRSQLDFYRSIVSPADGQSGPAIQALNSDYDSGTLSFDVTLVQAIKHEGQVQGSITVSILDGDDVIGQWPSTSARSVNYKYFQQISGSIEIADLTQANKVKVELKINSGDTVERLFPLSFTSVQ